MPPTDPNLLFLDLPPRRKPAFTYAFLTLNSIVFVLMHLAGGSTNEATLLAFGVKSNDLIDGGEIWRFVTPVFIHIGLLHLLVNSYALWIVGKQAERLYGGARFATMYVTMGVSGVVGSYLFHPSALSAGASGAIFGLFGVLFVFGIRHSRSAPRYLGRAIWAGILPIIVINLIIGFLIPVIDNAAHIGGLLAGMLLGAAFDLQVPGKRPLQLFRLSQVGSLAVVILAFVQVGIQYDGPVLRFSNLAQSLNPLNRRSSSTAEFIRAVNAAQRSLGITRRAVRNDTLLTDAENVSHRLGSSIDLLREAPSLSARSDRLIDDLKRVLETQYTVIEDIRESGRVGTDQEVALEQNLARCRAAFENLLDWVEADGAQYGLRLRTQDGSDFPPQPEA